MSDEGVQVKVGQPIEPEFLRPTYSNNVNVNFGPHDFRLVFSLLQVPLTAPVDGEIHPTVVSDVVVPATVMHALIGALRDAFDKYIEQYGAPGMDPQGPRDPGGDS